MFCINRIFYNVNRKIDDDVMDSVRGINRIFYNVNFEEAEKLSRLATVLIEYFIM